MRTIRRAAATLLAAGLPATAFAAGFQINEHSATATGRASSVIATTEDASSIFHNPAGIANTEGTQFMAGVSLIRPRGGYQGVGVPSANATGAAVDQETVQSFVPVPYAYVTRALSQKAYVGFGFYAPYGLGINWDDPDNANSFVGRTVVKELSLRSFFLTPTIALRMTDAVLVGVSVSLVPATVYLRRSLGATDNLQVLFPTSLYGSEGEIELAGTAFGVGANAGVQIKLMDNLRIGLSYRSAVDLSFSGKVNFTVPAGVPSEIRARFPDGDGDASVTLPHALGLGVGWVDGPLTVEASLQYTLWESYDELRVNFASGLPTPSSASPRNWENVPLIRLGGQYQLDALSLRAGLAYDVSPVPDSTIDPTLPDADRIIFTVGTGYDFGPARADIGYMGLILGDRDGGQSVNFVAGTYPGGMVHLLSVSLGVKI